MVFKDGLTPHYLCLIKSTYRKWLFFWILDLLQGPLALEPILEPNSTTFPSILSSPLCKNEGNWFNTCLYPVDPHFPLYTLYFCSLALFSHIFRTSIPLVVKLGYWVQSVPVPAQLLITECSKGNSISDGDTGCASREALLNKKRGVQSHEQSHTSSYPSRTDSNTRRYKPQPLELRNCTLSTTEWNNPTSLDFCLVRKQDAMLLKQQWCGLNSTSPMNT